jgi:hypothetical protein
MTMVVVAVASLSATSGSLTVLSAGPAAAAVTRARPSTFVNPAWATAPTWTPITLNDANQPIAMSSPTVANLDGHPAVVVGDRRGYAYAYHLTDGTPVAGWDSPGVTDGSGPIDSPISVTPGAVTSAVYYGTGDDADPATGGYHAFNSSGALQWFTPATNPPTDPTSVNGVQAGMSVGSLQGGRSDVMAGSLGQQAYALDGAGGAPLGGWPYFNSDSTHSTAALADLYGTGQSEAIVGGDQTAGAGQGQNYTNGGHLRILSGQGNLICRADTDQVVDSSPAVGGFLGGGATGIVVGTGGYFSGASDTDTLKAFDARCARQWSATLDGSTYSSPALGDIAGNGSMQVAEGTDQGPGQSGSVWLLDAATGQVMWKVLDIGRVIGSVVTADLAGAGYDDVIVPTILGTYVFDGRNGNEVADLRPNMGLQNSPLVTDDGNGNIGITLTGYVLGSGGNQFGQIVHYEVPSSNPAAAVGPGTWPMFHHDPQLTGNAGGTTPAGSVAPCIIPAAVTSGYNLVATDGGVFTFGGTPFCGSTGSLHLNAPVVDMAMAPANGGYWEVASDGGIFAFGQAAFYGSMGGQPLNRPIVGMAATPDGKGYWEVASDGGIFAFGDARFFGSMGGQQLNEPIVGISSSTDGDGYRMVASDGGIFAFGNAPFFGSMGGQHLNEPIVGTTNDVNSGGYWEVASDGGVFSFGAPFFGSMGGKILNSPIVGMAETSNGSGYRFAASDGGVFSFGAPFFGSMGGTQLNKPIAGVVGY